MPEYQLIVAEVFVERELASHAQDDTPLDLATAIWIPELCAMDPQFGNYPLFTERQLREAIARGELRPERHGRSIVVTRRIIKEWRETCRGGTRDPGSGSGRPNEAGAAGSSAFRNGSQERPITIKDR